ncbi:MAG: hypothetical protein GKR87_14750 [Kiritimatiellae bacterium]|nr:hypothetical protein [Kiritimatiellia bacterium]
MELSLWAKKMERELIPGSDQSRIQIKTGNRDLYGFDFKWIPESEIREITHPVEAVVLEREEYGNFYGFIFGMMAILNMAYQILSNKKIHLTKDSYAIF